MPPLLAAGLEYIIAAEARHGNVAKHEVRAVLL